MKLLLKTAIATIIAANMALANAADTRISYVLPVVIPPTWLSIDPIVSDWSDSGDIYGCTNWSPATETIDYGVSFMQTATDCKHDSSRSITPRQKNNQTGQIRLGSTTSEAKQDSASQVRSAIGEKIASGEITSFTFSGGGLIGTSGELSWSGDNIASYSIRSNSSDSGVSTSPVAMGQAVKLGFIPTVAGDYTFTLTATGLDGKEQSSSVQVTIKDSEVSGTMLLNAVTGGNQVYSIVNNQALKATAYNLPAGSLTQVGLLLGNYGGAASGTLSLSACGSSGCVSGNAPIRGTVDNTHVMITFSMPLAVQQGENVSLTYILTGAGTKPAVWTYATSNPVDGRSASTFASSGRYASMKLTYK